MINPWNRSSYLNEHNLTRNDKFRCICQWNESIKERNSAISCAEIKKRKKKKNVQLLNPYTYVWIIIYHKEWRCCEKEKNNRSIIFYWYACTQSNSLIFFLFFFFSRFIHFVQIIWHVTFSSTNNRFWELEWIRRSEESLGGWGGGMCSAKLHTRISDEK